jgi:hypothetical protein
MLRKPQFVVVQQSKYYPKSYMDEIPAGLMADPKYEIMCASLVIANTRADKSATHRWHAIAGFVCNGTGYIYDSNQRKVFKCNWWNLADFKKVTNEEVGAHYSFFKNGQINVHLYAFAIFARKEFTKNIGTACLLKSKAKTPKIYGMNFTDPNLGRRLNSTEFSNFLKPAELIALKRKWARTEHRASVYLNKAAYNSILANATSRENAVGLMRNLQNSGYKVRNANFDNFARRMNVKFPVKNAAPSPKTLTYANAKARLAPFTKSTAAVRKHQYSLVWKGLPMAQRKVLMHWRNKGEWLANNAFENKPKPPIQRKSVAKPKPKPKSPSPSPHAKRAMQVKSNFEKYWKSMQPENRQMVRNYIAAYKSPKSTSPTAKKLAPFFEPAKKNSNALIAAKRNVNALKTAKARKEYKRKRAVNMNNPNWTALGQYITQKNTEAQLARKAKKSAKA